MAPMPIVDIVASEDEEEPMQKLFEQMNIKFENSEERKYELENFISNERCEVVRYACYDANMKVWSTQLGKRYLKTEAPTGFQIPGGEEIIKLWSVKYEKQERYYRDFIPPVNLPGIFEFCGCEGKRCLANVAWSSHFCGYCLKRLFAWCLQEPSEWGVCRQCFLKHHDKRNVHGTIPSVPIIAAVPTNVTAIPTIVPRSVIRKVPLQITNKSSNDKRRNVDNESSDFVSSDDEENDPFSEINTPSSYATNQFIGKDGFFEFETRGGIIQPPKLRVEYNVDEIQHIADQSSQTITSSLWHLACNVVYDSIASEDKEDANKSTKVTTTKKTVKNKSSTVGQNMPRAQRMLLYFSNMELLLKNYPLRSDGSAILQYFHLDDDENPAWPPCFFEHWESIKAQCRVNLPKWKNQKNCVLDKDDKETMVYDLQVRVYVGFLINQAAAETKSFANNFANKHWPSKFRSGESPNALLQTIRRYYYLTEEAKRLSLNSVKQWVSTQKKTNIVPSKKEISLKLKAFMDTKTFEAGWYPPEWYVSILKLRLNKQTFTINLLHFQVILVLLWTSGRYITTCFTKNGYVSLTTSQSYTTSNDGNGISGAY